MFLFRALIWDSYDQRKQQPPKAGTCVACNGLHELAACAHIERLARKDDNKLLLREAIKNQDDGKGRRAGQPQPKAVFPC